IRPRWRRVQDEARSTMPADIEERPEGSVAGPHHEETFSGDVDVEVVAGRAQRFGATHEEPLAMEDRVRLALEPRRRSAARAGEGAQEFGLDHRHFPARGRALG